MTPSISMLLWIFALVCFFLAAIQVNSPRVNLVALGLFLVTLIKVL